MYLMTRLDILTLPSLDRLTELNIVVQNVFVHIEESTVVYLSVFFNQLLDMKAAMV